MNKPIAAKTTTAGNANGKDAPLPVVATIDTGATPAPAHKAAVKAAPVKAVVKAAPVKAAAKSAAEKPAAAKPVAAKAAVKVAAKPHELSIWRYDFQQTSGSQSSRRQSRRS